MPSDYISREAARPDAFCEGVSCQECPFLKNSVTGGCRVDDFIKAIPAADVRPVVKARWYWDNYKYDWCCSNCFHHADHRIDKDDVFKEPSFSFCPNCGADMREAVK